MLQIPKYTLPITPQTHERLLSSYFGEQNYKPSVSSIEQQSILRQLDESISREQFYFSISLKENRIMHCNGIARWLGYTHTDFSLKKYMEIIHPAHVPMQAYYGMSLLELLVNNEIKLHFMLPVCITIIALKHKNGKYIYCKRECSPFQMTEDNKMTEYLCHFVVIKKFNDESYHNRLYQKNEDSLHAEEKLLSLVQKKFSNHIGFSVQESRILKRYAQQKNCTSEMIGRAFKIEKTTVDTHNKRIIKKIENALQRKFGAAKEAALYFKQVGLI